MTSEIRLENVTIWGHALVDDEEEIGRVLGELKSIDVPSALDNQMITVDEDDPEGSTIFYADEMPKGPGPAMISKGSVNMLSMSYDGEHLSISSDIDADLLDDFIDIYDEILSITDVHIDEFDTHFIVDSDISSLSVSIDGPEEFDFIGYRFTHENSEYIVESGAAPESDGESVIEDTDDDVTVVKSNQIEHFDESESGSFISENVNNSEATINKLTS